MQRQMSRQRRLFGSDDKKKKHHRHRRRKKKEGSGENVKSIACGSYHSIAVTIRGDCYGWGLDEDGQLAMKVMGNHVVKPAKIHFDMFVRSVSCGHHHTLFLCSDGTVYSCGKNDHGQLGRGDALRTVSGWGWRSMC